MHILKEKKQSTTQTIILCIAASSILLVCAFACGCAKNQTDSLDQKSTDLAQQLVDKAKEKNIKLGTTESLTCGLLSGKIAEISGCSDVFNGGIASYAYSAKEDLLKVDKNLLEEKGPVNEETARQMAAGGIDALKCDVCMSTTGVAGPNSDQVGNKVGTVWIGCGSKDNIIAQQFSFDGDRQEIRKQTVYNALQMCIKYIDSM